MQSATGQDKSLRCQQGKVPRFCPSLASVCALTALLISPLPASIYRLEIDGTINPIMSEYIVSGLALAEEDRAEAILLLLRTPGGMVLSMSEIMEKMLACPIPIIAYVSPGGTHAASAGFFLLIAADVAAMAPGTRTGAAHPIFAVGGVPLSDNQTAKTLLDKITNDSVASLKAIAQRRGRDVTLVEKAIRESESFTETQALEGKLIDLIAASEAELLQILDGRKIRLFSDQSRTLSTRGQAVITIEMTRRQKLLLAISNPNLALLLFIGGALLLVFEFTNPGFLAPGIIGGLCVLLSLLGFSFLPINYVGVLLILTALALFVAEIKVQGFGILGSVGIVSMILGSMILIKTEDPSLRISFFNAVLLTLPFAALFLFLLYLAVKSSKRKAVMGMECLVGMEGKTLTVLNPKGKIFLRGEYWDAFCDSPIEAGEPVIVVAQENMKLKVRPVPAKIHS